MHFYKHNIGDYRRDTSHLSIIEHGAYRQLLDTYYLHEEPIPEETDQVFRRLSARTEDEQKAVLTVLKEFFTLTKEGYIHRRCDLEIREYQAKAETARVNGKSGGRPKKTESVISGLPEETQTKANHKPRTKNQEPVSSGVDLDSFATFWTEYPRKVAKPEAMKAWIKAKPDAELVAAIMAGLRRAKTSRDWTKDDGQFIPHPATWLNQQRWEDESAVPAGGFNWDSELKGAI